MNHGDKDHLICSRHNSYSWKKGDYCDECEIEKLQAENEKLKAELEFQRSEHAVWKVAHAAKCEELAALQAELAEANERHVRQQADSDSYSQNKKSDETFAKFQSLVDETLAAMQKEQP